MKKATQTSTLPTSFRTTPPASMMKTSLALGISTAMLLPLAAIGAEKAEDSGTTLRTVRVQDTAIDPNPNAQPGVPYKAKTSGDERHTRPLADTPQNISVLTKSQIDDSGYTDLRQILDAQPGITLGTGENGNAFGDRYIIRGQEARSDVFVDGLRDPGMTIRESFATEQIEISKGPNSSFAGRGTVGGAINSITKQATLDYNFTKLSLGLGSDDHSRITVDTNQGFGEHFALRANALYGYEDVPDRDPSDRERKGLALSGLWAPTEDLDIVLDYYGVQNEDMPDLGSYLVNRKPAANLFPSYAQKQDFLESDVDTVTARIKYNINDAMRVTNITRYGTSDNSYVVTGARQSTVRATPTGPQYTAITLSNHTGWQEVDYLASQTNLFLTQDIAGLKNEFIFSIEYSDHSVQRGNYASVFTGNCFNAAGTAPAYCASDAGLNALPGLDSVMNKRVSKNPWSNDWNIETVSAAVMDNIDLTDDLNLFLGVRVDRYDFDLTQRAATTLARTDLDYSDTLYNGHIGLTYELTDEGMVYASFATAADINGGESDSNGAGYGGIITFEGDAASADPEHTELYEIGTKWNVFDEHLLLTASVFQITKSDVMEGADYTTAGTFNTGENRVQGIEFGAVGEITDDLTIQAGYTVMDAEVLKSFTATNEGKTLSNFADNSAYLQLRYEFTEQFAIGGAAKYESKKYGGQPDTAAAFSTATGDYNQPVPSYTVYDLFATYRVNKHLDFRLNVGNITDKEYYTAVYRSGSFLYLGDARNYAVTVNYDF